MRRACLSSLCWELIGQCREAGLLLFIQGTALNHLILMNYMSIINTSERDRQGMVPHSVVEPLEIWVPLRAHTDPAPREAGGICRCRWPKSDHRVMSTGLRTGRGRVVSHGLPAPPKKNIYIRCSTVEGLQAVPAAAAHRMPGHAHGGGCKRDPAGARPRSWQAAGPHARRPARCAAPPAALR